MEKQKVAPAGPRILPAAGGSGIWKGAGALIAADRANFSTEPVFGILFAFLFLREVLSPLAYFGGTVILAAVFSMEFH